MSNFPSDLDPPGSCPLVLYLPTVSVGACHLPLHSFQICQIPGGGSISVPLGEATFAHPFPSRLIPLVRPSHRGFVPSCVVQQECPTVTSVAHLSRLSSAFVTQSSSSPPSWLLMMISSGAIRKAPSEGLRHPWLDSCSGGDFGQATLCKGLILS